MPPVKSAAPPVRTRVIAAATPLLAQHGIGAVAIEDILRAAGVSRRTFYKTFANKDELVVAIWDTAATGLLKEIALGIARGRTPRARLRGGIAAFVDAHAAAGPLIRVLEQEAMRAESPLYPRRRQAQQQLLVILHAELARAQRARVDDWALHALLWALEGLSLELLTTTALRAGDVTRARRVALAIAEKLLRDAGDNDVRLPPPPRRHRARAEPRRGGRHGRRSHA